MSSSPLRTPFQMASACPAVLLGHGTADGLHPSGHGAGVAVQGRPLPEDGGELVGIHGGDGGRIERAVAAEPVQQLGRRGECLLDGDLLVQHHPDQEGQGIRLRTLSAPASPVMWSAIRAMAKILARRPLRSGSAHGRPVAGRLWPCTSRPRSITASGRCSRWRPPGRRRRPNTWRASRGSRRASSGAILADLRRAGVVASQRGAEGGYRLARDPDAITIADVIRALDGPLAEVRGYRPEATSYDGAAENLQQVWVAVRASLRSVLEKVTLTDVISGKLPSHVQKLVTNPDAWVAH